jgi:hypothetical protein
MVGGHEWRGGDDHAWCGMVRSRVVNGDHKHGMVGGHSFWAWPKKNCIMVPLCLGYLKRSCNYIATLFGLYPRQSAHIYFILFFYKKHTTLFTFQTKSFKQVF